MVDTCVDNSYFCSTLTHLHPQWMFIQASIYRTWAQPLPETIMAWLSSQVKSS